MVATGCLRQLSSPESFSGESARQLVVDVELIAEMTVINLRFFSKNQPKLFRYGEQNGLSLAPYLRIHEMGRLLLKVSRIN